MQTCVCLWLAKTVQQMYLGPMTVHGSAIVLRGKTVKRKRTEHILCRNPLNSLEPLVTSKKVHVRKILK